LKLTDKDLVRAIEIAESLAESAGDLQMERVAALKSYLGENVNPAPEGRSQIVDRSVFDTIEAAKPQVLEPFLAGDEVVKFDPIGPEDEAQADQETAYVNHIILAKNDGHQILDTWFHDGALQKVGYVKTYWHEADETVRERYQGLPEDELALIAKDDEVEIVEHSAYQVPGPDGMPAMLHDVVVERKGTYGCVKIENVAPENVLVDANARNVSIATCDFFEHREYKTISQLRQEGFEIEDDIQDSHSRDWEDVSRDILHPLRTHEGGQEPDKTMRRVRVREVWMRIDEDDDGIAELRHYVVVGTTILDKDDADMIPVAAFCPIPLSHQHYGLSFHDITKEVEQTKTSLTRASLDNVYLAVNGRHAIDVSRVTLDDMLQSRPGGVVRVDGDPSSAIFPLVAPQTHSVALEMNEYMDTVRETRTGITRYAQGVMDPNGLNKTATGISQVFSAQQARARLVTRRFAAAFKELCLLVHAQTLKHARQADVFKLRNQWVTVDPRTWIKRKDLSVTVGLGAGNKQEQAMFLQQMLQFGMQAALPLGLTDPPHLYKMLAKLNQAAGFPNPEEFWTDPTGKPQQPPPPDPKMVEVQQKGQIEQAKLQHEQQKAGMELQLEQQRAQAEQHFQMQLEQQKMAFEQWKAKLDAETKIVIAELSAKSSMQQAELGAKTSLKQSAMTVNAAQEKESLTEMGDDGDEKPNSGLQALVDAVNQNLAQLIHMNLQHQQQVVQTLSKPKQVMRGPDGKIVGVQ
jgi:hypothetical protein